MRAANEAKVGKARRPALTRLRRHTLFATKQKHRRVRWSGSEKSRHQISPVQVRWQRFAPATGHPHHAGTISKNQHPLLEQVPEVQMCIRDSCCTDADRPPVAPVLVVQPVRVIIPSSL